MNYIKKLEKMQACSPAVDFCRGKPLKVAWKTCERGDWLLWILARTCIQGSVKHRKIVLSACACARLSLKFVKKGEKRPLKAIETAEKWAKKEKGVTLKMIKAAACATSADDATYAYAYAYTATYAATCAATCAACAATYAATCAATYAARKKILKKCAEIVRDNFPEPPKF